ncbi:MAG: tyrosine-protein kinase family protein, partial [Clostridia bacterium]|nr:tyrosine-protein kinase family protein [Clostridia bacterium]
MSLCLAVVSGKGGTGKSTVSCGLATSFSRKGNSVLIVDLDKGLRCIDSYFGI